MGRRRKRMITNVCPDAVPPNMGFTGIIKRRRTSSSISKHATCILCGESLAKRVTVRYQGWLCHAICTNNTIAKHIEGFSYRYFYFGIFGILLGISLTLPTIIMAGTLLPWGRQSIDSVMFFLEYPLDYVGPSIANIGIMIGLVLHSVGLFGFMKNYKESLSIICVFVTMLAAFCYGGMSYLLYTQAPITYDSVFGVYYYDNISGYMLTSITSRFLIGILSILVGVMVLLLEYELGKHSVFVGVLFIFIGGILFIFPFSVVTYLTMTIYLFFRARLPSEWLKFEMMLKNEGVKDGIA